MRFSWHAGDRPPRYGKKRHPLTVGRGPVPRHHSRPRTLAGDRPPPYGKKRHPPLTVGRGPVPRRAPVFAANARGLWAAGVSRFGEEIAGDRPPRYVPSDVFRVDRTLAGDRPPRSGKNATAYRRARACPSPCAGLSSKRPWTLGCGRFSFWRGDRGGQAPALRSKRRFSCGSNTRGGQAPALREKRHGLP